jgi:glutaminase
MKIKERASHTSPVFDYLARLHKEFGGINDGNVATYIPELAKANPDWFGICLVTATGAVYEVGDTQQPFTIQSISKPFVYGLALEDNGRESVLQKVGTEPTGDAFNSISLEPGTGRPRNPMINAGAIATAGLIAGRTPHSRFKRVMETFSRFAGRELTLDDTVYRSESDTGHRNRAIGHMLRNFDILTTDPIPIVDLYFKQCSISVTCRDLGVMAATLANRGVNPITGKTALRGEYVESVLSVMETCGMYDYAGEWLYNVGMPAKSGVSGGVIAVLPGQLGIGVFSPRLDARGNSVRGIRVCQELSRHFDLHLLNRPTIGRFTIRVKFTAAEFNSSRVRTVSETRVLREFGREICVWQLQGNLSFSTAEVVGHDLMKYFDDLEYVILDFKRVLSLNESACHLLYGLFEKFAARGKRMFFTYTDRVPLLRRFFRVKLGERFAAEFRTFEDNDLALEWCENLLLKERLTEEALDEPLSPEQHAIFAELTPEEFEAVRPLLKRTAYKSGEAVITTGDEAREMFLLARGRVSVVVQAGSGANKRLATFSSGMAFGEMALIDRAPRSAMIIADTPVECDVLTLEDFERLGRTHPAIKIKLQHSLCLDLCRKLRKANRELSVFD